jgi:hypothetical protein
LVLLISLDLLGATRLRTPLHSGVFFGAFFGVSGTY